MSIRTRKPRISGLPYPADMGRKPLLPTAKTHWETAQPKTVAEMQDWIQGERELILAYLRYWKNMAQNENTRAAVDSQRRLCDAEWKKWEPEADVANGTIYDDARRREMIDAMNETYKSFRRLRTDGSQRNECHTNYTDAQAMWEDFLYFQNAWNRNRSNDVNDVRGPRHAFEPTIKDDESRHRKDHPVHTLWRENMIRLYNQFRVGDRSQLRAPIGPDQLHMYPDNLSHRLEYNDAESRVRLSHLKEHFPTSDLRLDHEAITKKREEIEQARKQSEQAHNATTNSKNYATIEKLPKDHIPYHATTEHTHPWRYQNRRIHTSWETSTWGPAIANHTHIPGKQRKCRRPRYESIVLPRLVCETGIMLDARQKRIPDPSNRRNGGWKEGVIEHMVFEEFFELDAEGKRVPSHGPHWVRGQPRYEPKGRVTEAHEVQYSARREVWERRAAAEGGGGELLDDEGSEFDDDDVPVPDLPKGAGEEGGAESESGSEGGSSVDGDEEESDDEGDVFTNAYLEASGLPVRPRSRKDADGADVADVADDYEWSGRPPSPGSDDGKDTDKRGKDDKEDKDDDDNDDTPKPGGDGGNLVIRGRGLNNSKPSADVSNSGMSSGRETGSTAKPRRSGPKPPELSKTSGEPGKKRTFGIKGETFEDDPDDPEGPWRYVQCTYKFSDQYSFTQRDRVPAHASGNEGEEEAGGEGADEAAEKPDQASFVVYPRDPCIPVRREVRYKNAPWKQSKDGLFRKDDLTWRPKMMLRKFREDTGEYAGCMEPFKHFEQLINGNLPDALVHKINKAFRQYMDRNDTTAKEKAGTHPRWTTEEIAQAVGFLNEYVCRRGVVHLVDNWDKVVPQLRKILNDYRVGTMREVERGAESVRTKCARAKGLQKKLEDAAQLKKSRNKLTSEELRPEAYFNNDDFKSSTTEAKITDNTTGSKSKKRTTGGKRKGRSATEEDSGSEDGSDGDEGDDEPEGSGEPSKRRRKE